MISRYDKVFLGMALGVIGPALSLVAFWFYFTHTLGFRLFLSQYFHSGRLPQILSLCVIINLVSFFLFLRKNYYFSARGVLVSTFLLTIIILIIKYFL